MNDASLLLVFCISSLFLACTPDPSSEVEPETQTTSTIVEPARKTLSVPHTEDFEVTGEGTHPGWAKAEFATLVIREGGTLDFQTQVKMLYSNTGLYVLMEATDSEERCDVLLVPVGVRSLMSESRSRECTSTVRVVISARSMYEPEPAL